MRALALALCLLCSGPALGAEPVDLAQGQAAPYAGGLCDADCAARILAKRRECEIERDRLREALTDAPPKPVATATWIVAVVAFVAGAAAGVALAR